jgi:hypothetical protein
MKVPRARRTRIATRHLSATAPKPRRRGASTVECEERVHVVCGRRACGRAVEERCLVRRDSGRSVSVRVLVPAWRQLPWRRWWRLGLRGHNGARAGAGHAGASEVQQRCRRSAAHVGSRLSEVVAAAACSRSGGENNCLHGCRGRPSWP